MNSKDCRIEFLADYPEYIDVVTRWYWEEWHKEIEGWSFEETRHIVKTRNCNKDKLNINIIAVTHDGVPMGTMQLMDDEFLPGWEEKGPWIGALYIDKPFRNKGLAYRLGYTMMTKAAMLGFEEVYFFTENIHNLPKRHHFTKAGDTLYGGKPVVVYRKDLFAV